MVVPVDGEVVDEELEPVLLGVAVHDRDVHVLHEHLDLTALPGLPEVAGNVEEQSLERKGYGSIPVFLNCTREISLLGRRG